MCGSFQLYTEQLSMLAKLWFRPSTPDGLWSSLTIFLCVMILPSLECDTIAITHSGAFSSWILSHSSIHLILDSPFQELTASLTLLLNKVACLAIHSVTPSRLDLCTHL